MSNINTVEIFVQDQPAGTLEKHANGKYSLRYYPDYAGPPISLTLPKQQLAYEFDDFPAVFEGLLPEGPMLEALLKRGKLDRNDYFGQLLKVGENLVGALNVRELKQHD